MTESRETEEELRERAHRLHRRAHEVMDLLKQAAPHIQAAYSLLYDAASTEPDLDNKITCYIFAGELSSLIALMNEIGHGVHDPHRWGFNSALDELLVAVLEDIFKHEQAEQQAEQRASGNGHRKADA